MAETSLNPFSLDDYFQTLPIGSIDRAIGNNLYGINHRQIPNQLPSNRDTYGLTFFTRPQLNLQADNIRNSRLLMPLLNQQELSIQRYVRCMLDPRLMTGYSFNGRTIPKIDCPVLDNHNPFITIATNTLNSISGWPDIVVPTYTSEAGLYNESTSQVDGIISYYETVDIEANFRNIRGDVLIYLFYIWEKYMSLVYEGKLVPYLDFLTENEYDYNTRIYRLVLDQQKNTVTKIAAVGAAFPISLPTGSFFDYTNDKPYNDQNKDISIKFKALGMDVFDDITIKEFNKTVSIFNPDMEMVNEGNTSHQMVKLTKNIIHLFNSRGYPRINPDTRELEWWVHRDLYTTRTQLYLNTQLLDQDNLNNDNFQGD